MNSNFQSHQPLRNLMLAILTFALIGSLISCTSSPATTSNSDPTVDFSKYKTFAFLADLSTDKENYQSLESTYLKNAVGRELEQLGLEQVAVNPDLAINFSIETEEKIKTRNIPTTNYGMGYDPYYDVYRSGWGASHTTQIDQFTEGKLDIDAIDIETRSIVWQGTTKGRLTTKDRKDFKATLDEAVREIFQFAAAQP
jgi:hypothetical protein